MRTIGLYGTIILLVVNILIVVILYRFLTNAGNTSYVKTTTIPATGSNWAATVVSAGGTSDVDNANYIVASVNGTANAAERIESTGAGGPFGFSTVGTGARIDWDKELHWKFSIQKSAADANTNCWIRLGQESTSANITQKGIGLQIINMALYSESFGTARGSASLGVTLTAATSYDIEIKHFPANRIEWWVNGILKYVETTTNNIPAGIATGGTRTNISIVSGTPGAAQDLYMTAPIYEQVN